MCKVMVLFKAVVLRVGSVFSSSLFDEAEATYNTGQSADAGWPVLYMWVGSSVLHLHHAAEAHEGHSEDAGGDEGDGNALHRGG